MTDTILDAVGSGIDERVTKPERLFGSQVDIGFAHLENFLVGRAILEKSDADVVFELAICFVEEDIDFDGLIQQVYGHISFFQ
jgi:hypothetical protein